MKNRRNIFTVFNLILFISSLLFSSLNSFSATQAKTHSLKVQHEVNSKTNDEGGCTQLLFEKIENETEHDLHEQAIILPFSIAYFDFELPAYSRVSAQPIVEKLSNPIYISVCNFRI